MKNENEEADSVDLSAMEEGAKKRERKKKKRMPVSGKEVFKIKELKEKKEEISENEK